MPKTLRELTGPYPWPIVGNIFSFAPSRIHLDLERASAQYGGLFRVYFGKAPVLVVANHATIQTILRERPKLFRRPSVNDRIAQEMGGLPNVFQAEGDDWRIQRRMVMAGFTANAIKAYFPVLQKVALRLQARWDAAAQQGSAIDLTLDLKSYAVDIVASLAFGQDVNTLQSGENELQKHIDVILLAVSRRSFTLFPYWRYVRLPQDRQLDRSVAALRTQVSALIAAARSALAARTDPNAPPRHLLEAMILEADKAGSGISDEVVAGNVSTLLIAGEDTTAHSIAWLLHLLHHNPQAMARAREEVRQLAPSCEALTIAQLDSMDYVDACIQEAMRLKPVAPFLPLEAVEDTQIDGVTVPAGTVVMCLMRRDGLSEAHFQAAQQFRPERWLAELSDAPVPNKHATAPFGAGPRTCPGRYLALLEIKTAVAMLLGRFELTELGARNGRPVQEFMGFVMSPLGLEMRLAAL